MLSLLAGLQHVPAFHESPMPQGAAHTKPRDSASYVHQQCPSSSPEQGESLQLSSQPCMYSSSGSGWLVLAAAPGE